jgi:signal transduction histidine kinase
MQIADSTGATQLQLLMTYAAELELEVDRLRRRDQFMQHEAWDHVKQLIRVGLALRVLKEGCELRITDNRLGMPGDQPTSMLELFYRAAPTRAAGLGVGLAVVKLIVEQCCGTVSMTSGEGQGTSVTVMLPRYDVHDHVDYLSADGLEAAAT